VTSPVDRETLIGLAAHVWDTMLSCTIASSHDVPSRPPSHARVGAVQIRGAWTGAVVIHSPETLARRWAGIMFDRPESGIADEEMDDAVRELANMVATCVKGMVAGSAALFVPSVAGDGGLDRILHGMGSVFELDFNCEGESFRLSLLERSKAPERRAFTRVSVVLEGEVSTDGGPAVSGLVRDISFKGIFLMTAGQIAPGHPCNATLYIGGRSGVSAHAVGRVARATDDGLAIEFDEILGLESIQHLHNLVLFNAAPGAVAQVERDFAEHLGLRRIGTATAPPAQD